MKFGWEPREDIEGSSMRLCSGCHNAYRWELIACPACGRSAEQPGRKLARAAVIVILVTTLPGVVLVALAFLNTLR